MFPAGSQAVIRLLVYFKKKKFMVVVAGDATFQDVKTEIARVYQGLSSASLDESPPIVGEVQDVYGCALFSEYPVATILRDLSDVYAFEEGETPPTVAEQDLSMPSSLPYYGMWPYPVMQSTPGFPCGRNVSLDARTEENSCVLTPHTTSYCSSPPCSPVENALMQSPSRESVEVQPCGREKKPKWKKRKYKSAAVIVDSDSSGDDKKQKHQQKERQKVECVYPGFSSGWSSEDEKSSGANADTRQECPLTSNSGEEKNSGSNEAEQELAEISNLEEERNSERQKLTETSDLEERNSERQKLTETSDLEERNSERQELAETSNLKEGRTSVGNQFRPIERQEHPETSNSEEVKTSGANEHRPTVRQESVETSSSEDEGTSAGDEFISVERQEDAENSNSEGERTSEYRVVESQELIETSSSEEERTFTARLVERQKLAETSKLTSTEVNKTAMLKRKSEVMGQSSSDSESSTESIDERPHKFMKLSPLSALVESNPGHKLWRKDLQKTVVSSSSQSQSVSMKLSELLDDEELWD